MAEFEPRSVRYGRLGSPEQTFQPSSLVPLLPTTEGLQDMLDNVNRQAKNTATDGSGHVASP